MSELLHLGSVVKFTHAAALSVFFYETDFSFCLDRMHVAEPSFPAAVFLMRAGLRRFHLAPDPKSFSQELMLKCEVAGCLLILLGQIRFVLHLFPREL